MTLHIVEHSEERNSAVHLRSWLSTAIVTFGVLSITLATEASSTRADELRALGGEWIFVEDHTEGRTLEELGPPMASKFSMQVEDGAVVLNGHGSGHRDVRIALDGSITEVTEPKTISRYRGEWKDDTFGYQVEFVRASDNATDGSIRMIRRSFRVTANGLLVRVRLNRPLGRKRSGSTAMRRTLRCPRQPRPSSAT